MPPEIDWSDQIAVPLMSLLLLVPLLGMIALTWARTAGATRAVGLAAAAAELVLAVWLAAEFQVGVLHTQFVERYAVGSHAFALGVDGTSVLFVPLTALLALVTLAQGVPSQGQAPKALVASVLFFEWSLIGTFTSRNLLQLWLFGLLELVPFTLAVRHATRTSEGGPGSSSRIVAFRLIGEALVLTVIVVLGWQMAAASPGQWSFDLSHLVEGARDRSWDDRLAVVLFYGLAVRLALFPFHAWLPELTAGSWLPFTLLLMVSLKAGAYALLRFAFPVFPAAAEAWSAWAVALGLAGMVYGALMALRQVDIRRLIAFATISQNGALLVALFALNHAGLQGGLLLALNLCLATAGLFFASGLLHQQTGTTRLDELGGLFERLPLLGLTFLAAALGTLAMPGTPGFEAAHLALEGMLESFHWSAAYGAAAGNVLVASVLLWAYQRIFFTRAMGPPAQVMTDLRGANRWVAALLCAVIFGVGLYAHPWIETVSASLAHLASTTSQESE